MPNSNRRSLPKSPAGLTFTQPDTETPAAELDPLRSSIYKLSDAQRDDLRTRLLAIIVGSVTELGVYRLQEIARFIDITEHDQGCTTPAEEFITRLVSHYHDFGLTPDYALHAIEGEDGFRRSFDDAVEIARRFAATYPELVAAPTVDALAPPEQGEALANHAAA